MLSKENIRKLIFGGLYKIDEEDLKIYCPNQLEFLNDQHYGLWVPVHSINSEGQDKYYMLDTYQIDKDIYKHQYNTSSKERYEYLIKGLESLQGPKDNGNWVSTMPYDYFYSARIQITDKNIHIFKLYIDLHQYTICPDKENRYYKEQDLAYNIKLYNCHSYFTNGINLVRKEAKIDPDKRIKGQLQDMEVWMQEPISSSEYSMNQLKELLEQFDKDNITYDKEVVNKFIQYNEFLCKQQKELKEFKQQFNIISEVE